MSLLGKLSYYLYYRQVGNLKLLLRQGVVDTTLGYIGQKKLHRAAKRHLEQPITSSTPRASVNDSAPVIAFLGGDRNIDLVYASLCSLYVNWFPPPAVFLLSDGRLSQRTGSGLATIFPGLTPIYDCVLTDNLEKFFPRHKFPNLRALRDEFLLTRKLLDVYSISPNWTLFLDADTFFMKTPVFLKQWFSSPQKPIFLLDRQNAYTYPLDLMNQVAEFKVPEKVNTGLVALKRDLIDWEQVEWWYGKLAQSEARNHFTEQSLFAMILGKLDSEPLPSEDYICQPTKDQIINRVGTFHHYVWPCRYLFYGRIWQDITKTYASCCL